MSGIAGIYVIPRSLDAWERWSFVHAAHHRDVNRAALATRGVILPEYPLDPPGELEAWLTANQVMHVATDAVLGVQSFPLEGLDPTDEEAVNVWIHQHGWEHKQWAQILGIG